MVQSDFLVYVHPELLPLETYPNLYTFYFFSLFFLRLDTRFFVFFEIHLSSTKIEFLKFALLANFRLLDLNIVQIVAFLNNFNCTQDIFLLFSRCFEILR